MGVYAQLVLWMYNTIELILYDPKHLKYHSRSL